MKNFVLAIIATLLLTGCKRSTPLSEMHRWERTSVEQADCLTLQLAQAYARSLPVREKSELTDSLSRLARHTADPRVKARAYYWRARMAWNIGRQEYAREEITGAMRRLDSARDLAVTAASIPAFMYKGKETPVKVTVKNNGIASETDYTVSLFIDGERASSVEGREIAPDQELEFHIPYTVSTFDSEEWRYAEVTAEFQADEELADNTSPEVKIHTVAEDFAPVEALSGEFNNEGVALSWNAPLASQADGSEITDDFESYDSWSDTPSPWLTYDADGKLVALVQNAEIPGLVNATKSFWIFDSTLDDIAGSPLFASHSGDKMIVSICPHDQSMQDDWLISPVLSGEAQTISFFARSFMTSYITTFEVRYSDGSLALADFKLAYTDATGRPDGSHIYNVTALYPLGESAPEQVMVEVNGLDGLHADRITVTGAEGYVIVKGAESLNATLTTPYGRIFFSGTVPADGRIASPAGVVVVSIAGTTAKVSVK